MPWIFWTSFTDPLSTVSGFPLLKKKRTLLLDFGLSLGRFADGWRLACLAFVGFFSFVGVALFVIVLLMLP